MTLEILDCTIRDGGYVNDWKFSAELVRETYRALSKSGITYVELGFRGSEKFFDPQKYGTWRFSSEKDLLEVTKNIHGSKIAIMGDYGKISLEDFSDKKDSCVDLVRIAVHKTDVLKAIDLLEKIKLKGYLVSLQCMGYSCYSDHEKKDLLNALKQTDLDYIYVADSYGSIFPFHVKEIFEPFLESGMYKVGFHPHNNIQMAFANTLEALRVGVDIVDTTVYGIGRGAGNLPTEILLSYFSVQGNAKYNTVPLLNCIERYFLGLMEEIPWGYQLPYMISGIFNSHPNYSKELLRRREYSMEDIWKALEFVRELMPVGFDGKIVDNLIGQGFIGLTDEKNYCTLNQDGAIHDCVPTPTVPYANRYQDREFLVLANGPTLKQQKAKIDRFIDIYNPVILGANFLSDLFKPHYHAFNNKKRFVSYVNTVSPNSKLLIGINIPEEMINDYVQRNYERLVFRDILDADFDIQDNMVMSNCRTISVLLIGVAIVMGANRVFVAGMDGYLTKDSVNSPLFYEEKFDLKEHELNVGRHRWNEKFIHQADEYIRTHGGEGIHILTPTSHSKFFKSIENYI